MVGKKVKPAGRVYNLELTHAEIQLLADLLAETTMLLREHDMMLDDIFDKITVAIQPEPLDGWEMPGWQ